MLAVLGIIKLGIPLIDLIYNLLNKNTKETNFSSSLIPAPVIYFPLEATNSAEINVTGRSFFDGEVILFLNGEKTQQLKVSKDSDFSFSADLKEGENQIYAVLKDSQNRTSLPSSSLKIYLKTNPPNLEIYFPKDNLSFSGNRQRILKISGKTEENCQVFVNDRQAVTQKDGNFNYNFSLSEGENKIKIISKDSFGNQTEKEITVLYAQ